MTTTQKAKEPDTMRRTAEKGGSAGKGSGKQTMDDLSFEHADAVRHAVQRIKGINAMVNACVSSETVGYHIYSSQLYIVMDDVLSDSCKALDDFLSAAGW